MQVISRLIIRTCYLSPSYHVRTFFAIPYPLLRPGANMERRNSEQGGKKGVRNGNYYRSYSLFTFCFPHKSLVR
jgi:hypothetical protein